MSLDVLQEKDFTCKPDFYLFFMCITLFWFPSFWKVITNESPTTLTDKLSVPTPGQSAEKPLKLRAACVL